MAAGEREREREREKKTGEGEERRGGPLKMNRHGWLWY